MKNLAQIAIGSLYITQIIVTITKLNFNVRILPSDIDSDFRNRGRGFKLQCNSVIVRLCTSGQTYALKSNRVTMGHSENQNLKLLTQLSPKT